MSIRTLWPLLVAIELLLGPTIPAVWAQRLPAAGRVTEPSATIAAWPPPSWFDRAVYHSLQDGEPGDEAQSLPELPETVVRGRPEPFPANSLEGETVVTPTRTETPASEVGSSFSVVTQQEIQASGLTNAGEILRDVVGVDVVRQGGPGSLQSVFIRGANSQQTKVLLDGIPINDPSNATRGFDFSTLDVENIERIEVLRGPQSLLYGSDAIGGVINIITRRGYGPLSVHATGRGGTFGTSRESLTISGGNDRVYYSFGGAFSDTAGVSQAARRLGNTDAMAIATARCPDASDGIQPAHSMSIMFSAGPTSTRKSTISSLPPTYLSTI